MSAHSFIQQTFLHHLPGNEGVKDTAVNRAGYMLMGGVVGAGGTGGKQVNTCEIISTVMSV